MYKNIIEETTNCLSRGRNFNFIIDKKKSLQLDYKQWFACVVAKPNNQNNDYNNSGNNVTTTTSLKVIKQ